MSVKVGQHWGITHPKGIGASTFTVIGIRDGFAIVQAERVRKIKLSTFDSHKRQYKLLKDAG